MGRLADEFYILRGGPKWTLFRVPLRYGQPFSAATRAFVVSWKLPWTFFRNLMELSCNSFYPITLRCSAACWVSRVFLDCEEPNASLSPFRRQPRTITAFVNRGREIYMCPPFSALLVIGRPLQASSRRRSPEAGASKSTRPG